MSEQLLDFGLHVDPSRLRSDRYFEGLLRFTATQVMHYNDCPDEEAEARREQIKADIAAGSLPPIGFFALTIEDRFPGFMPAVSYVEHFSQLHAPVAAPGLSEHDHDVAHVTAFERQFRSVLFASVVARASRNALTQGHADDFADLMDALGDHSLDIIEGYGQKEEFANARLCLGGLAGYCHFGSQELRNEVCTRLCFELGVSDQEESLVLSSP